LQNFTGKSCKSILSGTEGEERKKGENIDHVECEEEKGRKEIIRRHRRKGSRKRTRRIISKNQINLALVGSIL
jgi:hypothetical protein